MTEIHCDRTYYAEFIEYLDTNQIPYSQRRRLSEPTSALEIVKILIGSGGAAWVAKSLIDWLKIRRSITLHYKQSDTEIKIENITYQELERAIEQQIPLLLRHNPTAPSPDQPT